MVPRGVIRLGFNPCCIGLAIAALNIMADSPTGERVSILVVLD